MEALVLLLLTLGLAVLVFLAIFRGSNKHPGPAAAGPSRRRRTIVVRDPAIAKLMLIDHADDFPKVFRGNTTINTLPQGPMWRALRRNLTSEFLHPTRFHLVMPLQQETAEAVVADLSTTLGRRARGDEVVVVRDSLHAAVFALAARLCFGDGVDQRFVRAMGRELLEFATTVVQDRVLFESSGRMTRVRHWRRWLRYSGTVGRVHRFVRPLIIAARRNKQSRRTATYGGSGGGDTGICSYVESLLDLHVPVSVAEDDSTTTAVGSSCKHRPLTDKEIVGLVWEFLGANTLSVVACVEWTLAHLVIQPEVQKKLHREIVTAKNNQQPENSEAARLHRLPYLRAVMLESLRLHGPVTIIRNAVVSAKDAAEILAPAASAADDSTPAIAIADIYKIGRNSKVWTDPDEFRPEHFLAGGEAQDVGPVPGPKEIRMLPFGAGPRYCPGIELGMLRVGCILTALVHEFQWALPADGDSVDLKEARGFFTRMNTPLRARITLRAR